MLKTLYTLLLVLLMPLAGFAQHEASTWYLGNGNALKFKQGEATVVEEGPERGSASTYSYEEGKVLLYTQGASVYNKAGVEMNNGTLAHSALINKAIIIPKPGSRNLFYVLYLGRINLDPAIYHFENNAVMYALVDITADNGKGTVLEKDKVIYANLHGYFTVSSKCANDSYWLVGETNTNVNLSINSDQLLAFKIDANGIAKEAVSSIPVYIGHSYDLKFSPKGDKLVFNHGGPMEVSGTGVVTFDPATGEMNDYIWLERPNWNAAFSASGDKLYLVSSHMPSQESSIVLQYDLSSDDSRDILASKTTVFTTKAMLWNPLLAPDGKIYIPQLDQLNALTVINFPERNGTACNVVTNAITFPSSIDQNLTYFATNYLYDAPVKADAGTDKAVCTGQPVQLGGSNAPGYTYYWEPATYLSNPNSPTPTFTYSHATSEKLELTYTLYVNDGDCVRPDVVTVTVLPTSEKPLIAGSKSVCPGVEEVDYSVEAQEGYTYHWVVSGGQLKSGQGTAAIKVTWGPSNPHAQVRLIATNAFGCQSEQAVLPVRINVELTPETPQGPESICLNKAARNLYKVTNTNGSVYTWGIKGGILLNGQGTNQVTVSWLGVGNHELWIQEQSTTVDTVCYGISDKLHVQVFQDPTAIDLDFVSIASDEGDASQQQWHVSNTLTTANTITLYRRVMGTDAWINITDLPKEARDYTDAGLRGKEEVYEYKMSTLNNCDEPIESSIHRTIRLEGQGQQDQDRITLTWNAYSGWARGVAHYEVWRKLDNQEEYRLLDKVDGKTLLYPGIDASAGFQHQYKIKATAAGAGWSSWSNAIALTFEHALLIPNIFTPNGDGYNDTFFIPKLELYSDNELVVANRYGKEVYRRKGYQGNWNGENVVAGTYSYQLYIGRLNKYYKGWVEILK